MLPPVVEDVRERVTRLAWSLDDLLMVAVGKHSAFPTLRELHLQAVFAIDVLCRGNLKALHPTRKGDLVVGLDDQMDVRLLNADVDNPKCAFDFVVGEL